MFITDQPDIKHLSAGVPDEDDPEMAMPQMMLANLKGPVSHLSFVVPLISSNSIRYTYKIVPAKYSCILS